MCIKTETGHCQGCEAFNLAIRLMQNGAKYQGVMDHVETIYCKDGVKPEVDTSFSEIGLKSLIIEGEKIK